MKTSGPALFAALACLIVVGASAIGMRMIGAPGQARAHRLDDQRIEALRALSRAVEHYHADHDALPATLEELAAEEDGIAPPLLQDPESGLSYDYRVADSNAFELCAIFAAPSAEDEAIRWRHEAGRRCFLETVKAHQVGS